MDSMGHSRPGFFFWMCRKEGFCGKKTTCLPTVPGFFFAKLYKAWDF